VGELAVVFDKYERDGLLEAKRVMMTFLEEMKRLGKSRAAEMASSCVAVLPKERLKRKRLTIFKMR
jgi:hypothetical protein